MRVSEDMALTGYDDRKVSAYVGLSSIAQDMAKTGETATTRPQTTLDHCGTQDPLNHCAGPQLWQHRSSQSSFHP